MFADLAKAWLRLATDLENSQALLDSCSELSETSLFASGATDYEP
jgi:hypothetical protein